MIQDIDEIIENFSYLTDWEDRYKYVIELGKTLPPMEEGLKSEANRVRGCASQVWLATQLKKGSGGVWRLQFSGDSDAHIVRGLVAIVLAVFNDKTPDEILTIDAQALFDQIQLKEHLSAQRANGLGALLQRIKSQALSYKARA